MDNFSIVKNLLADEPTNPWLTWVIMGVLVLAVIGLFVWSNISNKKKKKEAEEKVNKIKIGDRVKTIGGVCGFIAELNDKENTFVLKTGMEGSWSYVKFDKAAIYQTAPADAVAKATPKEEAKKDNKPADAKPADKKEVASSEEVKENKEVKKENVKKTTNKSKK